MLIDRLEMPHHVIFSLGFACTAEGKATNSDNVMVTLLDSSSRESAHRDMDTSWENQNGGQKIVDDQG